MKTFKTFLFRTAKALALALTLGVACASATPWSFGIMSDTQWPSSPDGKNPNVAVNVVNHLNQQFIGHGVKFVVAVGDFTDGGTNAQLDTRATFAQALYNAGIGFYPLRGNHESSQAAANEFRRIFPQTGAVPANAGKNNQTPANALMTTTYYGAPPANTGSIFTVGSNFVSEPTLEGLTYSFDHENARFVLIDQFTKPSPPTSHSNLNQADIDWIGGRFSDPARPEHAFSFAHKHLISENHDDNLFNSTNPDNAPASTALTNTFMSYLYNNGVRYHFGGHDHMHNRAIVTSPDGLSKVQNIIAASDSYKFYIPKVPMAVWHNRETQIAQEIFAAGYYIVTVDGPKVTVDHYASPNGCNGDCDETYDVIPYTFTKRESFGHSLNGKEVVVPQGGSLALTDDTTKAVARGETGYAGTQMAIVAGTNGSTSKDFYLRPLSKAVDTGWVPKTAATVSDVLTLWGLHKSLATDTVPSGQLATNYAYHLTSDQTDIYVLSMSYDPTGISEEKLASGLFGLAAKNAEGNWINAVGANYGGTENFVERAYNSATDALGTYGIDAATNTAWAVVNHQGDFAVADFAEGSPELYPLISRKAGPASGRVWTLKLVNGPDEVTDAAIDGVTLTQTGGASCTPVLGTPTAKLGIDVLTPFDRSEGDIAPAGSVLNSVQYDFSTCAPAARFNATINYSANGGALTGSKTFYNQFR